MNKYPNDLRKALLPPIQNLHTKHFSDHENPLSEKNLRTAIDTREKAPLITHNTQLAAQKTLTLYEII